MNSRRFAAHHVVADGCILSPGVVELVNGQVERYYKLECELPYTEWMDGTIEVVDDAEGRRVALLNGTKQL